MTSARPPKAAAGSPPLITLPKVNRSASTGSSPYQPAGLTRNPVITSSMTSTVPCGDLAQSGIEPGRRRHRAHVAGGRLGDDAGDVGAVLVECRLDGA